MEKLINLEKFAEGALSEKFNVEFQKVLNNIADLNTDYKRKRKLTIDLTFNASEDRELALVDIQTKTRLAEPKSVGTRIIIGTDGTGSVMASELSKQIPGQSAIMVDEESGNVTTTAEKKQFNTEGIKLVK